MSQAAMIPDFMRQGVSLVRGAFPETLVAQWREIADRQYARIALVEQREGLEGVRRLLPPGEHYLPNVSSISLRGVYVEAECREILEKTLEGSLREQIESQLGGPSVCSLDRCWVRRQYAIDQRPAGCAPHSWHQDGALLYPFDSAGVKSPAADGLLRMITCWLPLTPCGRNAPGLEFVLERLESLQLPAEITDDKLRVRYPAEQFWAPELESGDAVIFAGGTLHRTHVEPQMQLDRTSIELRFFRADEIPSRLAADRFMEFPKSDALCNRSS